MRFASHVMNHLFKHEVSGPCRLEQCTRNLCQYQHSDAAVDESTAAMEQTVDEEIEDSVEQSPIYRKQCHLCHTFLNPEDNLVDHMETNHREYFDGMMEATAEMSL